MDLPSDVTQPTLLPDPRMYNRLFTKILDSSIWLEPSTTRIVWITLLAAMDQDGFAHFSALENLASRARVSLSDAKKAVEILSSPDPNSANPENEGRRIERVPGGFVILNAVHYKQTLNREIQREQTRLRVAKHRNKDSVTSALQGVTPDSDSVVTSKSKCTQKEAEDFCESLNLPRSDGEAMFLHWEDKGWGKVKDWKATIRKWKAFGYLPSQKNGAHKRPATESNRNIGTANEGKSSQYKGVGKVR